MKDQGLDRGLVQDFDTSKRGENKHWYGFRKMFWKYLNKLHVPFYDPCCTEANGSGEDLVIFPLRYNSTTSTIELYNGTTWAELEDAGNLNVADFTADTVVSDSVTSDSVATDSITEQTAGHGVALAKNVFQRRTATAVNVTATTTAAAIVGGLITSTSAAAVALTLPLSTDLATYISAVQGTSIDFMVDNSAGANTVTVTPNTGITAVTAVVTGGATLTVASGAVGTFRIFFTSATVAKIARLI